MRPQCPSCDSIELKHVGEINPAFVFASHQLADKIDGGHLYHCKRCALAFRYPTPSRETLAKLYQTSNLTHWQYEPEKRQDWQLARKWLEELAGRDILDVGCYDGAFLEYLGAEWNPFGIEINAQAIDQAKARGVEIITDDLYNLSGIDQRFDAVVAFDVAEHVQDPADLLARMLAITRKNGLIILATGNFDARSWKMMGSSYWYCTIPEHLVFISKTWCERVVAQLPLDLIHLKTYSHEQRRTNRLVLHELLSNMLYRSSPKLFAALRKAGIGDKDASQDEALALHPPTWTTARDHLLAIFRKT